MRGGFTELTWDRRNVPELDSFEGVNFKALGVNENLWIYLKSSSGTETRVVVERMEMAWRRMAHTGLRVGFTCNTTDENAPVEITISWEADNKEFKESGKAPLIAFSPVITKK